MKYRFLFLMALTLMVVGAAPAPAHAANPFSTIQFPIAELGNCASLADCKDYCDIDANVQACIAWGQAHGLVPKAPPKNPTQTSIEEALKAGPGPGACTTLDSCKTYCADKEHQAECLAFAKAHHLLSKENEKKVDIGAKLDALIAAGDGPGGCTTRDACATYCKDPSHRDECIAFSKKVGVITDSEGERIAKLPKTGPGGCASPEACAAFCSDAANHDTCVTFAKEHGLRKPDGDASSTPPMKPEGGPRPYLNNSGSTTGPRPFIKPFNDAEHASSTMPGSGKPNPTNIHPPKPFFIPHDGEGSTTQGFIGVPSMFAGAASAFERGFSWIFSR